MHLSVGQAELPGKDALQREERAVRRQQEGGRSFFHLIAMHMLRGLTGERYVPSAH
jgi:hypothetical protein